MTDLNRFFCVLSWAPFLRGFDTTTQMIILAALLLVLLVIVVSVVNRLRAAASNAAHRRRVRHSLKAVEQARAEEHALAQQIVATSSTSEIRGLEIVRQIEAVFTDGHKSPPQAVEALKAQAARRGGNALINLQSQRLPTGNCVAQADAVVVKPPKPSEAPPNDRPTK